MLTIMLSVFSSLFKFFLGKAITGYNNCLGASQTSLNNNKTNQKESIGEKNATRHKPYYESLISKYKKDDFWDYSGGLLGI
ncbi:MAG: hypothetical protein J0M08_11425 [Bacteroidetes bacterium]|nr:hypothetical protein [Bacteroidota bacterium]